MADLHKLFKKASPDGQPNKAADGASANGATESKDGSPSASGTGSVQGTPEAKASATPKPANPFARSGSSGSSDSSGQSGGGTRSSSESPSSGGESGTKLANVFNRTKSRPASSDTGSVDAPAIESLDSLDKSVDAGESPRTSVSQFDDETPATKPTRELPDGLSAEQLGFIDQLDSIYGIMHDPGLLGDVIKGIMVELSNNPEYTKLMSPHDIRAMVKGMRDSMGLARVKKQESKKGKGSSRKSKALDVDMLADLEALGIPT